MSARQSPSWRASPHHFKCSGADGGGVKAPESFVLAKVPLRRAGLGTNPLTVLFHRPGRKQEGRGKQMLLFLQEKRQ